MSPAAPPAPEVLAAADGRAIRSVLTHHKYKRCGQTSAGGLKAANAYVDIMSVWSTAISLNSYDA